VTARPKRALGQNFLVDPGLRRRIVEAVRVQPGEVVLEIGPGRGALTEGLAAEVEAKGGRLVLVELDDDLAAELAERYAGIPAVTVLHRSILDLPLDEITPDPSALKVVGNIPYNLTSPILFHLLERPRPREALLMVQKEVADRVLAPPGGREYGALSVGVRTVAEVERVLTLGPGAFRPRPKVDSTVLRIRPFRPAPLSEREEWQLRTVTRAVFQWRRKQLGKILRDHPVLGLSEAAVARALAAAGAAATDRPETLSPERFVAMARVIAVEEADR
jgi:16S rRNA (adenine1518-N6/adenine1519-N6)-dimethyltransferase